MDKGEVDSQEDYTQRLHEEIYDLNKELNEVKHHAKKHLMKKERITSISINILIISLLIVYQFDYYYNIVDSRFYPTFSIVILSSIFVLIALSLTQLLSARSVLSNE